jgi:hypothetical protein
MFFPAAITLGLFGAALVVWWYCSLEGCSGGLVPKLDGVNDDGSNIGPDRATWRFVLVFHHDLHAFKLLVQSYQYASASLVNNLIIVDNSPKHEAWYDASLTLIAKEIIRTPNTFHFSEMQNFVTHLALQRRLEFFLLALNHQYVLPRCERCHAARELFGCLRQRMLLNPSWAVIFFNYRNLVVYRTQALVQVPFDPSLQFYGLTF